MGDDFYYIDVIFDYVVEYVKGYFVDDVKLFVLMFMYVVYIVFYWLMYVLEEDIEWYYGWYDIGWDVFRLECYYCMIEMGLIDEFWELFDCDVGIDSWFFMMMKVWYWKWMEVYVVMIDWMDFGIGWIVKELEEWGEFDNMLILFLVDNGGCVEEYGSWGLLKFDVEICFLWLLMDLEEL